MNKRKILLLASALLMVAILGIGGTLAYFTDTDSDHNVMTVGNIKIVQNETDRNGDAYEDGQALYPAVIPGDSYSYDATMDDTDGSGSIAIFGDSINNEIDKVVSVTNNGSLPAYVRTILLFENDVNNEICSKIHTRENLPFTWVIDGANLVKYDGVTYSVAVVTYEEPVAAGATSTPSLLQLWLDPSATNEWFDMVGEEYDIIVISQAAQTVGFEDAENALDTAFGEVTIANVQTWVDEMQPKTTGANNVIGGVN